MKKSQRMVMFYDLATTASARTFESPEPISVRKTMSLIELVPEPMRAMRRARATQTIYISDMEVTGKFAKLLINRSDRALPDPIFSIPSTKQRRTAQKKVDEGQDFSCHIVVRFPDHDADPALMLIEQCPGLSVTVVGALLRQVLRMSRSLSPGDFVQKHPDGSVDGSGQARTYRVTHSLRIDAHPSETFLSDLNQGEIQTLEMVTRKFKQGFDTTGYFQEDKQSVVFKPSLGIKRPANLAKHVLGLVTGRKADFHLARIHFKLSNGEARHVDVDPEDGIPEQYVKRVMVKGFTQDLQSSYDKLHQELVGKMTYLASHA